MNVILITTDGKKEKAIVKTFVEARELICGSNSVAEIISLSNDGAYLFLDEEGKLKNRGINYLATEIAHDNNSIYPSDYIVGDVLLVEDTEEFDNLPYK